MRFIFVFLLFFTLSQAAQNRLVIGTYSSKENAEKAEKELQAFIKKDDNFFLFVANNNLKTAVVPLDKFYVTTLEPFNDTVLQQFALNKLRTLYDGTFVLPIIVTQQSLEKPIKSKNAPIKRTKIIDTFEEVAIADSLLTDEPSLEELEVKTQSIEQTTDDVIASQKKKEDIVLQTSQTTKQNIHETKKEISVLEKFILEIIALITVLIAIVVYFTLKRVKHQKEQLTPLVEIDVHDEISKESPTIPEESSEEELLEKTIEEEMIPESISEPVQEQMVEPIPDIEIPKETLDMEDSAGKEEGSFGVIETIIAPEPEKPTQSRAKKRQVPPHAKITKQNFKEFAGMRILVAEDNLINQKVISGLLADTGIEIVIADDGKEALDILQKDSNFTLILMDAHMPRIDGFEATRKIRATAEYNHILVVALSGDIAPDDIKKMKDAGMEEHLAKPLKMDALYDVFYAYWAGTESEKSDEFVEVIMTSELQGDEGLTICGGDEDFYKEILNEFLTTYASSAEHIHTYLETNQMQKADKLLLDIVGITSNIGAKNLNTIAQDLKDALLDTKEQSYLTLADEYEKHLHYLLRDIKAYSK